MMHLSYILVPLGIILSIYFIYYFAFYRNWIYGCVGKITFKSFKAFYAMNPKQWSLWDGCVEYTKYKMHGRFYDDYVSGRLSFNQIDALKYQRWRKKLNKQEKQENTNNKFKEILNELQNDIDNYRKETK